MIEFRNVIKSYPGGHTALAGISLTISRGDMVILRGHSGAGKSTLLKLIPALERPTSGVISINDQAVNTLQGNAIAYLRRNLGVILQDNRLLHDRTAFDNVMLPLVIMGTPHKEATRRVYAAIERVGLGGREKAYPQELSGGEQQRLAVARAIVHRPAILIADEPTAHLDPGYAADIASLFRSFNASGVTVIVSTHDPNLFNQAGATLLRLHRGQLVDEQNQPLTTTEDATAMEFTA